MSLVRFSAKDQFVKAADVRGQEVRVVAVEDYPLVSAWRALASRVLLIKPPLRTRDVQLRIPVRVIFASVPMSDCARTQIIQVLAQVREFRGYAVVDSKHASNTGKVVQGQQRQRVAVVFHVDAH